uniref:Protein FAM221A n=1 Tax=Pavo cristatus TaxID=9049 RepID=A0A8C9L9E5_PAVCR
MASVVLQEQAAKAKPCGAVLAFISHRAFPGLLFAYSARQQDEKQRGLCRQQPRAGYSRGPLPARRGQCLQGSGCARRCPSVRAGRPLPGGPGMERLRADAAALEEYVEYRRIVGDDDGGKPFTPEEYEAYKRKVLPIRLQNRLYVSWRSPTGMDCKLVGPETPCFCTHRWGSLLFFLHLCILFTSKK